MKRHYGYRDQGILSVGQSVETAAKEMLEQMVDEDSELISLYYGQDVLRRMRRNLRLLWRNCIRMLILTFIRADSRSTIT